MFQSSKQRQNANEQHLCATCKKSGDCNVKPSVAEWRYVLQYCQRYEGSTKHTIC